MLKSPHVAALTCALLLGPFGARTAAQDTAPQEPGPKGPYIAIRVMLQGLEDSRDPAGTGAELTYDGGAGIAGSLGYRFGIFRPELEAAFRSNSTDELRGPGGPISVDGAVSSAAIMANGFLEIPLTRTVRPYLGAGLGFARVAIDGDDFEDDSDAVFAYQAAAGLSVQVTPLISLVGGYRYFATDDATLLGNQVEYTTHNVEAGLRFDF